jgi:predicted phage terminase large subunit-like protein
MSGSAQHLQDTTAGSGTRKASQLGLIEWAEWVIAQSGQVPASHHLLLLEKLDAVARGDIDRLMVLMPPGSAKSTYASLIFPAFWLAAHPATSVIATSHTASLAGNFSRQVRQLIRDYGNQLSYRLVAGEQAADHWRTSQRGEYFAAGVRGPLTGRRADIVIIDDPIKSHADADSPTLRERLWDWYRSDLTTRLKPRGRIVLIMTRWREDDLAGRLLAQNPAEWHVLRLPAFAEEDDPLNRKLGAALWPEWEDEAALLRKRNIHGERIWSTLYQQSPRAIEGSLFKTNHIDVLDTAPITDGDTVVRAWDLAATASTGDNDPDWTVGVKLARDRVGRFIILDVVRLRGTPHAVQTAIVEAARIDGRAVLIGLPEDPGQAGKHQVLYLTRELAGYRIRSSRESGAKITRAGPVASQVEARNFAMVRGTWNHAFLDELHEFPFGRKDDQVDALSRAFLLLTESGAPIRHLAVSVLPR